MRKKIPVNPIAVGPDDTARIAGVSRSRIYELLNSGELPSCKDGRRRLIRVADIEAWLDRLPPGPKQGSKPTGPLLTSDARWRARNPKTDPTGPLLPVEQQQIAIERVSEPPPPIDRQQPAVALAPAAPDLAAVYAERFKLIVGNVGPDEARLRAFEYAVGVCRAHYRVDLETAKKMVSDAIRLARAKEPATP